MAETEMVELTWTPDPDPVTAGDLRAMSGKCQVGTVSQSRSGRWCWEIVMLPGDTGFRDARRDWADSLPSAKKMVEAKWSAWLVKAALSPPSKE